MPRKSKRSEDVPIPPVRRSRRYTVEETPKFEEISKFNDDIIYQILLHLDARQLFGMTRLSKRFYSLIEGFDFDKKKDKDINGKTQQFWKTKFYELYRPPVVQSDCSDDEDTTKKTKEVGSNYKEQTRDLAKLLCLVCRKTTYKTFFNRRICQECLEVQKKDKYKMINHGDAKAAYGKYIPNWEVLPSILLPGTWMKKLIMYLERDVIALAKTHPKFKSIK